MLHSVDFSVEKGDIFGYLGPNGAGKTTSIRVILGLLAPDGGTASILGRDASIDETRRRVGFVLESDGLYDNKSAEENLLYYARIYDVDHPGQRTARVLELVNLAKRSADKVGTFSKGMRQRLALARAMIHDPQLLVLDEPTAGVDPIGQMDVREIVLDMAHREQRTIFISSHNLDEVQRICNRIALINRGHIVLYGQLEQLRSSMGGNRIEIETSRTLEKNLLEELKNMSAGPPEAKGNLLALTPKDGFTTPDIVRMLVERGAGIEAVSKKEASLEEIYSSILSQEEGT